MRLKNVNMLAKSKIKRYKRKTFLMVAPMGLFFWRDYGDAVGFCEP